MLFETRMTDVSNSRVNKDQEKKRQVATTLKSPNLKWQIHTLCIWQIHTAKKQISKLEVTNTHFVYYTNKHCKKTHTKFEVTNKKIKPQIHIFTFSVAMSGESDQSSIDSNTRFLLLCMISIILLSILYYYEIIYV